MSNVQIHVVVAVDVEHDGKDFKIVGMHDSEYPDSDGHVFHEDTDEWTDGDGVPADALTNAEAEVWRKINAHDALVAALERAINCMERLDARLLAKVAPEDRATHPLQEVVQARAALALAKGE